MKDRKAMSPVVASIILVAVTVAISIAVAAWMGAFTLDTKGTWNQQMKDRINTEIQKSGITFNITTPSDGEYHFFTNQISCLNEEEWQNVNATLNQLFKYIKSNPDNSFYACEKCPSIYIGYIIKTFAGLEFVGIEIELYHTDC